ncbi:MAG TPA: extracellular solute-binding protein, partial [Anaerolineales bacterium]|nr:extracellular solute-binding protein [Anaerolineales bacterium]
MTRYLRFTHFLILFALVGCSSLAPILSTPTPAPVLEATSTPQAVPTPTVPAQTGPKVLRVWLPPQFDPLAETEAAGLLNQRLKAFEAEHPDLKIEVRIKTNVVDFLSRTNRAAPDAMPDLVALSYEQMQVAAGAGLLHPLEGLTDILQDSDWFVFARELGSVQSAGYGFPFAADAQLIIYRSVVFETPPSSWGEIIESGAQLAFPMSGTEQYFPLSLYISANGQFVDEQGMFTLDEDVLVSVLSLYQQIYEAGAIPINIRDYQTDLQALNSYRNGEADLVVTWASSDIGINSGGYTPLLGLDSVAHSVGNGWVWSLAGSNTENQQLAIDLASFLVESDYMAEWTLVSSYLPTRPLAVAGWEEDTAQGAIDDALLSAHPVPSSEIVSVFGPIMQGALIRIFNGEQAEVVARSVMEEL